MMRTASLKIINALGIEGGCNVQMALNPDSFDYYIIEVNPRVSRSSALASKATGYPIARVAAKIAVGLTLDQIENQVTGTTKACFEPALDYCVVKIPRWPFDKFASGDRTLFTQMKATGEVMAIDRTFESALMKAIRGLEVKAKDLRHPKYPSGNAASPHLAAEIKQPTDERLWSILEGLRQGMTVDEINKLSRVDKWFLRKLKGLIQTEGELARLFEAVETPEEMNQIVEKAQDQGFSDVSIKDLTGVTPEFEQDLKEMQSATSEVIGRQDRAGLLSLMELADQDPDVQTELADMFTKQAEEMEKIPDYQAFWSKYGSEDPRFQAAFFVAAKLAQPTQRVYKMVDTCAGEFESKTPYYYSARELEDDAENLVVA